MLIDEIETNFDSLAEDRAYVLDERYKSIQLALESDLFSAYQQFAELTQLISRLAGSLFEINIFSLKYIEKLQKLHQILKKSAVKNSLLEENEPLNSSLRVYDIFLEFHILLAKEKNIENYDLFHSELKSVVNEIESNEFLSEDNIKEFLTYMNFLNIGSLMLKGNEFNQTYYDLTKKFVDDALGLIRSSPQIFDPITFSNTCFNVGGILLESKLEEGREIIEYGLNLIRETNANVMYTRGHIMLGHYYRLKGQLDTALNTYLSSIETENVPLVLYSYPIRHIGQIYQTRGELRIALLYYKKSLDLFEFVENDLAVARTQQYIGNIYLLNAEINDAMAYFTQSLDLLRLKNYPRMIVDLLYSNIRAYLELSDTKKAVKLLEEMKKIKKKMNHLGISQVYKLSKALIFKTQRRWAKKSKAQKIFRQLLDEGTINHEYTIIAMEQLCELLVDEMRSEYSEEIFHETYNLVNQLYQLGLDQQLYQVQIQSLILQSQFDMIQGDFDNTLAKLSLAEEMCTDKNLRQLSQYVTQFKKQYLNEFAKWQNIVSQNENLEDRLANPEIQDYIRVTLSNVQEAHRKTEALLRNVLPVEIIPYLENESKVYAERFENVSILFADIVGFTSMSSELDPHEMVLLLNEIFSSFDQYLSDYDVEKIRTIGDNYMVVVGAPRRNENPTRLIAKFALKISNYLKENSTSLKDVGFRMGINTGEVVAGVVGTDKFNFDVWGDAVNVAARMESHGIPGKIQVTEYVYNLLKNEFIFEERGIVEIKGKEPMKTWFLIDEK